MEALESLYREEIAALKAQIDELKVLNKNSEDKNETLIGKVKSLQHVIEQANIANQDLHTAFEHVRDENLRLKSQPGAQDQIVVFEDRAMETVQRQGISWISDKDKYTQRIKFLERECERYNRDNRTLHKQANHLLRTLEEERGMIIRRADQEEPMISASDVIDRHLITYESIDELQRQNQKLISLVKELSKREEEQMESEDLRGLNKEIESLKSQLESVKNDRDRIIAGFNTIHKERDLFKILLCKTRQVEHMTPEIFQRMVSIACSSGAITTGAVESEDKTAHINDLKTMISKLEKELADVRHELEDCKVKKDEELKLKAELLEQAHLKIQQVDVFRERCEVLEANTSSLMKEYDEVRTKAQKLTFELEASKKSYEQLKTQQVDVLKERCDVLESNASLMMKEYEEVRAKAKQLTFELEVAKKSYEQLKIKQVDMLKESCQVLQTNIGKLMEPKGPTHEDVLEMQRLRNLERQEKMELRLMLRKPAPKDAKPQKLASKYKELEEQAPMEVEPKERPVQDVEPREPTPQKLAPQEPIPQEPVHQEPVHQELVHQEPLPQEPAPQEPLPEEPTLEDPVPQVVEVEEQAPMVVEPEELAPMQVESEVPIVENAGFEMKNTREKEPEEKAPETKETEQADVQQDKPEDAPAPPTTGLIVLKRRKIN